MDVAAALVFHQDKLLITQRLPGKHLAGFWEFPGGKREANESWEACLQREIREELGMELQVIDLFSEVEHEYPDRTIHLRFYRCAWVSGDVQALECAAFHWVTRDQLRNYAFPPADTSLLARLEAELAIWSVSSPTNP